MSLKNLKLQYVTWVDSFTSQQGWFKASDLDQTFEVEGGETLIHTVGWLVREDDRGVTLVQSIGPIVAGLRPKMLHDITIPKGCIVSRKTLGRGFPPSIHGR